MGGNNPDLLNERYVLEIVCQQHSFDPLCINCMEGKGQNFLIKGQTFLMGGGNPYPLNENYFFEPGCHQHRFDPLCIECSEEKADKADLSWNEVLDLISEKPETTQATQAVKATLTKN